MASSYISNALQINYDSVLEITDNAEMVSMFKILESNGLRGFLGCPSVLYEREMEQFFDTAMVKDRDITCEVSEPVAGMELADVIPTVEEKTSSDEAMTLEEILLTIPDGFSLPSTTGEVTKIQLGQSISIPEVDEGDWYKASLPKIPAAPLLERDPVKGIPPKEFFFYDSCKH
ncbi:protein HIRA [Dorcoceras hygrometricum]|uniref:Protein HIRA n=1 Tax=Dorcoceras hygrometricum TaxID=472368 RepID=A0A2Z7D7V6_9LAMI|nr:protein HIRA [Dorcoceras hygrometricum]